MRYVLALDQARPARAPSCSTRRARRRRSRSASSGRSFRSRAGVEHDAKEILRTQREVAREAVRTADLPLKDLMAVGITNQRETTIVWDRQSGEPIHNAIVWQDRRTAPQCEELRRSVPRAWCASAPDW
jgi:glycerol kinase